MWTQSEIEIELVFIRHGETKSNQEKRYLGKTEEMLCAQGVDKLWKSKKNGGYPPADILFTGPMKRCLQTAELLYPGKKLHIIPEWTEMDFGCFEGKNYEELNGDSDYQEWIDSNGLIAFPGGEDRKTFTKRCKKGFEKAWNQMKQSACTKIRAVCIVHGGTIMALCDTYGPDSYFTYACENGRGICCKAIMREDNLFFEGIQKF
ncbi:MAG: histidine phosphatase family protein [Lachnospiraceae bacterium]|nr:histidine phosphatase family protein [Lachnospiraceae bacterium]